MKIEICMNENKRTKAIDGKRVDVKEVGIKMENILAPA